MGRRRCDLGAEHNDRRRLASERRLDGSNRGSFDVAFPELVRVKQHFDAPREADVASAVRRELDKLDLKRHVQPGQTVALTAGSRGIANIALILRETAAHLRSLGAEPFLVPTMGSHGGGTAEGQREVIESYGITEEYVGAPIRASMEVVELGRNAFDAPVYLDREASRADHIGVVARVKPHTGFSGALESGLCKMMMIGLGKHVGAAAYHRALLRSPWEPFARSAAELVIAKAPIRFGLAIVENAYDETGKIESVAPQQMLEVEERLLELARKWMPRLPFDDADVLVIDRMGKEISGSGIDTNVVDRKGADGLRPVEERSIRRILVRRLSAKTHGNAAGIGLADFTTDHLVRAMDYNATVINCLTANSPEGANVPVHFASDREAIDKALASTGFEDPRECRIQHILDTLHVAELVVSKNYDFDKSNSPLEVLGREEFAFDAEGNLPDGP